MSPYVDGYVLPVAEDLIEEYRESAAAAGESWINHGALRYVECIGDDLDPDLGVDITTFPDLVGTATDETVVFAFVVFESRAHRDEVNAAVTKEMEEFAEDGEIETPFEVERMAYGGFEGLVEYRATPDEPGPTAGTG